MPASTKALEGAEQSLAMLSTFLSSLFKPRKTKGTVNSESAKVKYLVEHFRGTKEQYLRIETVDVAAQLLGSQLGSDAVGCRVLIRRTYAEILKLEWYEYLRGAGGKDEFLATSRVALIHHHDGFIDMSGDKRRINSRLWTGNE
jgi:hypothetical protein